MKFIVLISTIFLFTVTSVLAKVDTQIGASLALTRIRFQTNIFPELYDNRSGIAAAIKMQLSFSESVSIVPQLEYTQKGFVEILPVFAGEDFTDIVWGGSCAVGIEFTELIPLDLFVEFRYNWDVTDSQPNNPSIEAGFSSYDIWFGILLG
jgi:hypothetical protein